MPSNEENTEPGLSAKAHAAALKAQEAARKANAKADPVADRLLYAIRGSEYSAVIIVVIVLALVGLGLWLRG